MNKRQLKFRFQDKRFKGFLTFTPHPFGGGVSYNGQIYNSNDFRNIDTSTIQQFTGMKDKKGNEIFEGDILKTKDNEVGKIVYDNEVAQFLISFDLTKDKINPDNSLRFDRRPFTNPCSLDCEIVGNIFETNLLKCLKHLIS